MDVVALAQHGVDYAVATLGTATTPVHAQKLLRLTDSVVFCFDGDNAGRKAAWRALENALPVLADGKNARSCSCPTARTPTTSSASAARRRSRQRSSGRRRCRSSCSPSLSLRHPPASAEGRAALVAAAKPLLAQIGAPVLAALLRHRLATLTGLPEHELRTLLGPPAAAGPRTMAEDGDDAPAGRSGAPGARLPAACAVAAAGTHPVPAAPT